jgi:hypothetical protein
MCCLGCLVTIESEFSGRQEQRKRRTSICYIEESAAFQQAHVAAEDRQGLTDMTRLTGVKLQSCLEP